MGLRRLVRIRLRIGGGCGWFPLGWGEPFYPWYHGYHGGYVSQNYIRNVNVTNTHITNITNVTNNYYHNSFNNDALREPQRRRRSHGSSQVRAGFGTEHRQGRDGRSPFGTGQGPGAAQRRCNTYQASCAGRKPAAYHRHTASPGHLIARRVPATPASASGEPGRRDAQHSAGARHVGRSQPERALRNAAATHNVPRPPERGTTGDCLRTLEPHRSQAMPRNREPSHAVPKPPYAGGAAPSGDNQCCPQRTRQPGRTCHDACASDAARVSDSGRGYPYPATQQAEREQTEGRQASRSPQVESGHGVVASAATPGGIHLPCCTGVHRFVLRWRQFFLQREQPQLQRFRFALRLEPRVLYRSHAG